MLKKENNLPNLMEEMKKRINELRTLIDLERLKERSIEREEKLIILSYELEEKEYGIKEMEKYIKRIEFKEKVEERYENLLGDGKK